MKSLLKQALRYGVVRMPWGAREAIFDALYAQAGGDQAMLARIAQKFGITAITTTGRYGDIRSNIGDTCLFPIYAKSGQWARGTNDHLIDFFAGRGGTYIDIGANVGLTTIPVANNPAVKCIAIEPEPRNFANLKANISLNCPHGNVELHQVAIFDKPGALRFEIAPGNFGDHRVRIGDAPGALREEQRPCIEVAGKPLCDVVGKVGSPLAIKIDTQGAEPFVVSGARDILTRAGLLVIEFWPYGMRRMGGDPNEVISLLRGFHSLAIGVQEDEASEMPVAEAIGFLTSAVQNKHSDDKFYVDVIARRPN